MRHEDYLKAFYLVATVDHISRKNDIPLCDKYNSVRNIRLEQPYYIGDSSLFSPEKQECIDEFLRVKLTWINPRASICGSRRRAALGGRTHAPADTPPV